MAINATKKFNQIERDLKYMKEWLPKSVQQGKVDKDFAAYKIEIYEAIRMDYLKAMGAERRGDDDPYP